MARTSDLQSECAGSIPARATKRSCSVAVNTLPCHGRNRGFESHQGRHASVDQLAGVKCLRSIAVQVRILPLAPCYSRPTEESRDLKSL